MGTERPNDTRHNALQTLGILLTLVGVLLLTVGVVDLMSSQGYGEGNGVGWVALIGVPVAAAGYLIARSAFRS